MLSNDYDRMDGQTDGRMVLGMDGWLVGVYGILSTKIAAI